MQPSEDHDASFSEAMQRLSRMALGFDYALAPYQLCPRPVSFGRIKKKAQHLMLNVFTESISHVPPLRLSRLHIDEDKGVPFRRPAPSSFQQAA